MVKIDMLEVPVTYLLSALDNCISTYFVSVCIMYSAWQDSANNTYLK